jgi:hypothetical protein
VIAHQSTKSLSVKIVMSGALGKRRPYPVARARIVLDGDTYHVQAAVSSDLPVDALLGQDIFLEKHLARRMTLNEKKELHQMLTDELDPDR